MSEPRRRGSGISPAVPAASRDRPARPEPAAARRGARMVALIAVVAVVSAAVSAGVTLEILRLTSRTNPQTVDLGSNVSISEESAVTQVAGRAAPAVATIVASSDPNNPRLASAFGTTVDGYLVTNAHAVANAATLRVILGSDPATARDARLVDADCGTDVAVLKVDGVGNLPTLAFGDSNALKPGQMLVAVGGPVATGVSTGVVSQLHASVTAADPVDASRQRQVDDVIRTEAQVGDGMSGGPVLNVGGQVVGIAVATRSGSQPITYTVASADVQPEVEQIVRDGSLTLPDLGVTTVFLGPAEAAARGLPSGALVSAVSRGGPGEAAGFRPGDVITAIDDQHVADGHPLPQVLVTRFRPGQRVTVSFSRSGSSTQVLATLAKGRPSCG